MEAVLGADRVRACRVQMIVGLDSLDLPGQGRAHRHRLERLLRRDLLNLRSRSTWRTGQFDPLKRARGAGAALQQTLEWVDAHMAGRA